MTPKLGDFFPEEKRDKHADGLLAKGAVLRVFATDINNQKIKRLIIIGVTNEGTIGKVFINSDPQSSHSQIPIKALNREYLDHDSFVDCSRLYEDERETLLEILKADFSCYIGQVS